MTDSVPISISTPIFVSGATGNVGLEVVKALSQAGYTVRTAARDKLKAKAPVSADGVNLGNTVEWVCFDFKQPATFETAFVGVKSIFLMRPPDITNARRDMLPAIEAAKAAGVEQVVFLSLLGVENNKFLPHYKIEELIKESGLAWTFLRASFFMQNLNTIQCQDIKETAIFLYQQGAVKPVLLMYGIMEQWRPSLLPNLVMLTRLTNLQVAKH